MSWNNYPERDQGSSASIQWRGLSPGWHGMPMGSGCRRAWGSDATPGTEGAAGSFPLRSGSLLEREVNTSLLEILYLTGNSSMPPPPRHPQPCPERGMKMVPELPYRFARYFWLVFVQIHSLVNSMVRFRVFLINFLGCLYKFPS